MRTNYSAFAAITACCLLVASGPPIDDVSADRMENSQSGLSGETVPEPYLTSPNGRYTLFRCGTESGGDGWVDSFRLEDTQTGGAGGWKISKREVILFSLMPGNWHG